MASVIVAGRVSFPSLFTTAVIDGVDSGKYGLSLMIPKGETVMISQIEAAEKEACQKFFKDSIPKNFRRALIDGNEVENRPEYKDHWIIRPKSKTPPEVVDRMMDAITDPNAIRSGDYVRISCNFYGYNTKGNAGIASGLGNVQFLKRGDPLGNQRRAADEFQAIEVEDENEGGDSVDAFFK